jgi:hypothetical protein
VRRGGHEMVWWRGMAMVMFGGAARPTTVPGNTRLGPWSYWRL